MTAPLVLIIAQHAASYRYEGALRGAGIPVIVSSSFEDAKETLRPSRPGRATAKPDIILVMTDDFGPGLKFVRWVRELPGFEITPMLIMTHIFEGGKPPPEILDALGVKALTDGMVPENEILRFVLEANV